MPRKDSIRVLIADSTAMGCELLAQALKRSRYRLEVVGSATTAKETQAALTAKKPHVVVLNPTLGDGPLSGLELLPRLRSSPGGVRALVLLDSYDRELVIRAFRDGAQGVLCRSESIKALVKSIHQVRQGQVWASTRDLQLIIETLAQSVPPRTVNAAGMRLLTKREDQIAHLVAEGFSNRDISAKLGLAQHTVKNYLFKVYEKLGLSSRVELILCVLKQREGPQGPAAKQVGNPASE